MTEDRSFKRRVRERMSKTGESYATARSHVAEKRDRNRAARTRLAASDERVSDAAIQKSTGKTWDEWFPILDAWGAREKTHTEIARYVSEEHGVPGWWSQSVTVAYEPRRVRPSRRWRWRTNGCPTPTRPRRRRFGGRRASSNSRRSWSRDGGGR
jgi:hypothetical protein